MNKAVTVGPGLRRPAKGAPSCLVSHGLGDSPPSARSALWAGEVAAGEEGPQRFPFIPDLAARQCCAAGGRLFPALGDPNGAHWPESSGCGLQVSA